MQCHDTGEGFSIGTPSAPSFAQIHAQHARDPRAAWVLRNSILHGKIDAANPSVFMPGSVNVTPAQAQELAGWILRLP